MIPYLTATDDFQLEWPDAAMGARTWMWDGIHVPRALPRFAAQRFAEILTEGLGGACVAVNGYCYISMGRPPNMPEGIPPVEGAGAWWQERSMPACRALVQRVRETGWDSMTAPEIVSRMRADAPGDARCFAETIHIAMVLGFHLSPLIEFATARFGTDGPLLAATMLQGKESATAATGRGLERLAELALEHPEVAAALRAGDHASIAGLPGGAAFTAALDAWLDEHGWRVSTWFELQTPSWREDPAPALAMVRRYLDDPERRPSHTLAKSIAARGRAIDEARDVLDAEQFATLAGHLERLAGYTPIIEERAYWQQQMFAIQRLPLLALGRKLAAAGMIGDTGDIFHLDWDEIEALAGGTQAVSHEEMAGRRADVARWQGLLPPAYMGVQPDTSRVHPIQQAMFGGGVVQGEDSRLVSGIGASGGVVQGRARVAITLDDADGLQPGEVLVARFTAPTWTPLFATAGAVVIDHGGMLSHAALVAREYGLPAVVGTQVGTRQIPNGALVTVDGTRGLVRIEDEG